MSCGRTVAAVSVRLNAFACESADGRARIGRRGECGAGSLAGCEGNFHAASDVATSKIKSVPIVDSTWRVGTSAVQLVLSSRRQSYFFGLHAGIILRTLRKTNALAPAADAEIMPGSLDTRCLNDAAAIVV